MEDYMKKGRWGRVRLGEERVYSLAYADDVVLLAEEEEGIKCLISRLEKYLDEKGLELNREKTKVVRFRKGGERMKKVSWVERKEDRGEENKICGLCIIGKWETGRK